MLATEVNDQKEKLNRESSTTHEAFVRAFGSSEGSVEESFCSLLQLHHTRAAEEGIEAFCVGVGLNLTLLFAYLQLFFSDSLPSRS